MNRFTKRQPHTIISREIIKPSSPTPCNLKTYNLSFFDQIMSNEFIPMVLFYPNTSVDHSSHNETLDLKNSLPQMLTKYYPFAGRHVKIAPSYVDCNDHGVEFLEASVNHTLTDFLQNSQYEDLDHFIPYGRIWGNVTNHDPESDHVVPLAVQVNHFECGGVAVGLSISHKVADAFSLVHFLTDWAKATRSEIHKFENIPIESPHFIKFQHTNINYTGISFETPNDCVTRSFVFSNSSINDLKLKLKAKTMITNPSRVEVVTWLLSKCASEASTKNNSDTFKPTGVVFFVNIRDKMIERLPEKTIGNVLSYVEVPTKNQSEIMNPGYLISEFKKQKTAYGGQKNIETFYGHLLNNFSQDGMEESHRKINDYYMCSSICRFPIYEIDFGWGKPVKTTLVGNLGMGNIMLMDAPNEDGIEALVCLRKPDMDTFQTDPGLLAFCRYGYPSTQE